MRKDFKGLKEVEISNQGFSKDGWKLIKVGKDSRNNYYALIECENCGTQKMAHYYNFIDPKRVQHRCKKCQKKFIDSIVGNTYGTIKVLSFHQQVRTKRGIYQMYFNTKCTKCGAEAVRLYNHTQWINSNGCFECHKIFQDPTYNYMLKNYKSNAKDRSIAWELSNDDFKTLITSDCYYCGAKPQIRPADQSKVKLPVNGIDRINSDDSYNKDNCVPCCSMCNFMKQDYTQKNFLQQINKIYQYQLEKQGSTTSRKTYTQASGNGEHPEKDEDIV